MDLIRNTQTLTQQWTPSEPIANLFDKMEDCQEFADIGGDPISTITLTNATYALIFNTRLYYDDCKEWDRKPTADKTWNNFKQHFQAAQLRLQRINQHGHGSLVNNLTEETLSRLLHEAVCSVVTPSTLTENDHHQERKRKTETYFTSNNLCVALCLMGRRCWQPRGSSKELGYSGLASRTLEVT